ncbi:MAG: hypothetical protein IIY21_02960 [Clostridiales bacterium]|nr:hypothetical protein [Clostridiales bacterium]
MTNDEAINTLKNTAWLGSEEQAEKVSEAVRMAVEALKWETSGDAISRHDAIDALMEILDRPNHAEFLYTDEICKALNELPSAQPEPISDAYMKAVWTWLLDYQIKAAELKGRYTPYEVLSWVANDWRKEHEGSD